MTDALANEPDVSKGGKEVEFGIMILGGATALPPQERPAAPPMEEPMIQEVVREPETARIARDDVETSTILQSESFWEDLEGFLKMRLKDEGEAMRLRSLLRSAWESSS